MQHTLDTGDGQLVVGVEPCVEDRARRSGRVQEGKGLVIHSWSESSQQQYHVSDVDGLEAPISCRASENAGYLLQ